MLLAAKLLGAGLPLVSFQHPNFVGSGNCALCHSLLTDAARNDVTIDTHCHIPVATGGVVLSNRGGPGLNLQARSPFTDVKGYRSDATLDPTHAARLGRIIEAADIRGMVVLVGCLYWGTSRAHEDLAHWTQNDADRAVANTVAWLKERQEAHHSSAPLFTRCSICGHFVLSRSSAVRGAPRE